MPHRNNWRVTLVLFALTGLVESMAWGHMSAFTPLFIRELGTGEDRIGFWTGVVSSVGWIVGLPLLPFWGVWADRYGRKLIIVRSSVFAALVYAGCALSRDLWMLSFARAFGGFVMGNTGVMMAVQASITPREKLGTSVALINAGAPVGMAAGPYLGGLIVSVCGARTLFWMDAGLTALIVAMLCFALKEEPFERSRDGTAWAGVLQALRAIRETPSVAPLFAAVFFVSMGLSMAMPFTPILVERLHGGPDREAARAIGAVLSAGGLVMALATPFTGHLGDRKGHLQVLRFSAAGICLSAVGMAMAGSVGSAAVWQAAQGAFRGGFGALAIVLLALYTPISQRSAVLTISLLPQQLSWFLGPLAGTGLVGFGLRAPFWGSAIFAIAGWLMARRLASPPRHASHEGEGQGVGENPNPAKTAGGRSSPQAETVEVK